MKNNFLVKKTKEVNVKYIVTKDKQKKAE